MRGVAFFWGVLGGLAVLLGAYAFHPAMQAQPAAQSAFERVMQSKTIRCGYVVVAPLLVKDSATGQVSGPIYDIVTEVGKTLGLKIDWAEETSFAAAPEGLRTGRFDMMCANVYLRPNLMPYVEFTQPYYYIPVMVIQRKGETRFKAASDIDRPDVKVGSVDGTIPALLAAEDFKHAGAYALPENTAYSDNLLSIATHKADVSFVDPLVFGSFDKNNPNQLENGNILIFDNGTQRLHDSHTYSRVIEVEPQSKKIVWEYHDNPAYNFYSAFISGAQRLPNGNTLITEGLNGRIFEVTVQGEVVWEYVSPYFTEFLFSNRDKSIPDDLFTYYGGSTINSIFRSFRYAKSQLPRLKL